MENYIEDLKNFKPGITLKRIFLTIEKNRKHISLVRKNCFKAGIPINGILHDLSKWSPVEFFGTAKYFSHKEFSPIITEEYFNNGYSKVLTHHLKVNKHHYNYWYDEKLDIIHEIPYKYIVEMICDELAASKGYYEYKENNNEEWTPKIQYEYWNKESVKKGERKKLCLTADLMISKVFEDMANSENGMELLNEKYLKQVYNDVKKTVSKRKITLTKKVYGKA